MNLVGKILTFLIFVMCLVFASFALMLHAAHKNWREEIVKTGGYRDQVDEARRQLDQEKHAFKEASEQWKKDKDRYEKERGQLLADNDRLTKEGLDAQANILKLQSVNRELVAQVDLAQKNLANSRSVTDALRTAKNDAEDQRRKIWEELVNATNVVMTSGAEITRLEKLGRDLADRVQKAETALQVAGVRSADIGKEPPAALAGEVTGLQGPDVEISVGYDDGVSEGHRFKVTRPSTGHYIGDIVIYKVPLPNRAIGRPDKPTMRDQIQKGDNVQAIVSKHR